MREGGRLCQEKKKGMVKRDELCYDFFNSMTCEETGMLLLIDVGNTNIVFGLMEHGRLLGTFRQETDACRPPEELAQALARQLRERGVTPEKIEDAVLASVVPPVTACLKIALQDLIGKAPLVVDEEIDPGLPYEAEERLGADRAICCAAAVEKYGAPLILLDFGTATTVDAVGADGWYLGGCILAGIRTSANALFGQTAMLPQIDLAWPPTVLGRDAVTQIQAGAVMGAVGAMGYLVARTKEEMRGGQEVTVIATGGLASLAADHADFIDQVDENLIMEGLALAYRRHKAAGKA